jgi:hypothetical protein
MSAEVFYDESGGSGQSALRAQTLAVQQALDAFRQDYAPVLKVRVRRGCPAVTAPSAFLKLR